MDCQQIIEACEHMMLLRRGLLRHILSSTCLHLSQPEMLFYVMQNPGCSQRQMANDAGVTAASVAASFKRLENAGMIRRRSDTADLRCNRVYITQRGEEELRACMRKMQALNQEMLQGLDEEELTVLCRCLGKISENLEAAMARRNA